MKLDRLTISSSSRFVDIANYVGWPLLAIYGFSVFVYPWPASGWNWQHAQLVLDRWQTLNAGALAFIASLVAFNISRYNEDRQREREFTAAKAALPSALSSLCEYCLQSAEVFCALAKPVGVMPRKITCPVLPADCKPVFTECIRHADPEIGDYLANILVRLQIHDARIRSAVGQPARRRFVDKPALISYSLRLGELHSLICNLFAFARSEEPFQLRDLTWEDFRNSYSILKIDDAELYIDESMNLVAFTQRWLVRTTKQSLRPINDA